jgi:hypothetical protein
MHIRNLDQLESIQMNPEIKEQIKNAFGSKIKRNKYRNEPIVIDGIRFQSKWEGQVYCELKVMVKAGIVLKFERQVPFQLGETKRKYLLDFKVWFVNGNIEYWDAKGCKTQVYLIKKDLVEKQYGIKIIEKKRGK